MSIPSKNIHLLRLLHLLHFLRLLRFSRLLLLFPLLPFFNPAVFSAAPAQHTFAIGETDFLLDGQRLQIRCGEMHFARVPREYWTHRLRAIKAMGLNAVCAYLFWNYHEWEEGKFNWSGSRDVAEFCRLAQQEGLWVVLRPGPYACAEWEMGGLPWWLLKKTRAEDFLRTTAPAFMEPARRWLGEVGRVLGPLQITKGGPIIMVQVENEYGLFGSDAAYMRGIRQAMIDGGFEVPFFVCNPTPVVERAHAQMPDFFAVANFGSAPRQGFEVLRKIQKGPLMCGEFYPGWFDTWGTPHRTGKIETILRTLEYMLENNGSFSLYMAHGGTSFGLWGGCDRPFRPDTSSYDYDAPISEAGWITEKFGLMRAIMEKHMMLGEAPFPAPPAPNPVIEIPAFTLSETAGVRATLSASPRVIREATPVNIEQHGISRGLVSYRATLPPGPAGMLEAALVRDLAWVFLDGNPEPLGVMDTRYRRFRVDLPARDKPMTLELLVYTIARINFGQELHDRKGLRGPILFHPKNSDDAPLEIRDWEMRAIDFGADAALPELKWTKAAPATQTAPATQAASAASAAQTAPDVQRTPSFWRGEFRLAALGDTFLDMARWGTGIVWVNGHCLGRYWNIGPTQTMYLPAPWLKTGANEIVVLDLSGPEDPVIAGVKTPVLDQLRPEKDFYPRNNRGKLLLDGLAPVHAAAFAPGSAAQDIRFAAPASGRQFCIESIDAHDGGPSAAIAELVLYGADGKPLSQAAWTIAYANSEEAAREDGSALNAINGQPSDHWITVQGRRFSPPPPAHPHRLIIDLGQKETITGFRYIPRQGPEDAPGRIKNHRVYIGEKLIGPEPAQ